MSPARTSTTAPPLAWARPVPSVTYRVWPEALARALQLDEAERAHLSDGPSS